VQYVISIPQVNCNPNKLKVSNAMRADSVRPLIEGVPTHLAACGILI
jgi:hypothetical protein